MEEISKEPLMVSIRCFTYNQASYIRQCLEGFVMQKTNFRFEAIVHDDASTDKTADIIKEYAQKYPEIIKPIYEKENLYSKHDGSLHRVMDANMHGKYIAICEGDDYWIDPFKLQKQVDFLEEHPDYGLVYTKAKSFLQSENKYSSNLLGTPFNNIDELLQKNKIATLTTCYRTELVNQYRKDIKPETTWRMGDYPLWLYIASKSKVHYIDEITSVYRVLEESASHSNDLKKNVAFILSSFDIQKFFIEKLHKEYLLESIGTGYFYQILTLHMIHNQKFNYSYYKDKLKLESVPVKCKLLYLASINGYTNRLLKKKWGF